MKLPRRSAVELVDEVVAIVCGMQSAVTATVTSVTPTNATCANLRPALSTPLTRAMNANVSQLLFSLLLSNLLPSHPVFAYIFELDVALEYHISVSKQVTKCQYSG